MVTAERSGGDTPRVDSPSCRNANLGKRRDKSIVYAEDEALGTNLITRGEKGG